MDVETNEQGGRQSRIAGDMTEVPPIGLLIVSRVMEEGQQKYPREKDGTPNWHRINWQSNLKHGLKHAADFLVARNHPDRDRMLPAMVEELAHMAARALMALERFVVEEVPAEQLRHLLDEESCDFISQYGPRTLDPKGEG